MKQLKILGLVLLSALVFFMTACGEDTVQLGTEPTFMSQQTQPSTEPTVSTPVATDPSESTQSTEPEHVHVWREATCTSAKTCTVCGEAVGEMLTHNWDAGTVTKEATESAEGEMLYTCAVCGDTMTQSIPALSHEHSYTSVVTEPTCTSEGYTTYTCHCGDSYITNETAALGHVYGSWQTVTEATCTEKGEEKRNCIRCEAFETRSVEATGHDYTETVTAPTCTEQGYTTYTCHCGDSYITNETAALGHAYGGWQTVTEATCTENGEEKRTCTRCEAFETRGVAAKGHIEETVKGYSATCTSTGLSDGLRCVVCQVVLAKQEVIPKADHRLVEIPGKQPSETSAGLTNGKQCAYCATVVQKQVEIPVYAVDYSGDYYYRQMGQKTNGAALQKLYNRLDMAVMAFHFDISLDAEALKQDGKTYYMAFAVSFEDLGVSKEDAVQIWLAYKNDHPLYYWIDNTILYTDTELQILTAADYQYGADREAVNAQVLDGIREYLALAEGETSNYYIAWAFHDAVIQAIDYARDPETNIPEDDLWAHSILGVIDGRGVVCEGYSRMFQLLLNAADVENIYVEGGAGSEIYGYEAHAWNMVKLEDGAWYWCDLTWDDRPTRYLGILYNHFCVNDSQDINWLDGGWGTEIIYFPENHRAGLSADGAQICQVELPMISDHVFSSDDRLTVRTVFTVGDFTYSINGFYTVQLVSTSEDAPRMLHIPETVEYEGITYTVTAIGGLQEDGLYSSSHAAIPYQTKEIYLPKSIRFIWDCAMRAFELEKIHVDPENPWFTDVNGVLYTKSLYTLIQYPARAPFVEKYAIPDETREIANGALHDAGGRFSELVIGKSVEAFGRANWGIGYPDNNEFYGGNYVTGALSSLMDNCADKASSLRISVSPENPNYVIVSDVLYTCNNGVITGLLGSANSEITEAIIADGIMHVSYGAFAGCKKLVRVVLPDSVISIETRAFSGCASLTSIVIPESVTYIGDAAFNECSSLTSVVIPNGVTSIGFCAFLNCHSLTNIVVPGTVTSIGAHAFNGCYALNTITFAGTKEQWKAVEKGQYWNERVPAKEVVCVDGTVVIDG